MEEDMEQYRKDIVIAKHEITKFWNVFSYFLFTTPYLVRVVTDAKDLWKSPPLSCVNFCLKWMTAPFRMSSVRKV